RFQEIEEIFASQVKQKSVIDNQTRKLNELQARVTVLDSKDVEQLVKDLKKAASRRDISADRAELSKLKSEIDLARENLKTLTKQMEALRNTAKTSANKPIAINNAYQDVFETQSIENFDIGLLGCQRQGENVSCSLLVKNTSASNQHLPFYANWYDSSTRAFLGDGTPIIANRVYIGQSGASNRLVFDYPPNIPTKVKISFKGVAKSWPGFLLLEVRTKRNKIAFQNIAFKN
ncbi:MAG: hypothetical protein ACR2OJ_17395, partial [Hyphomicrobiales bacterium]